MRRECEVTPEYVAALTRHRVRLLPRSPQSRLKAKLAKLPAISKHKLLAIMADLVEPVQAVAVREFSVRLICPVTSCSCCKDPTASHHSTCYCARVCIQEEAAKRAMEEGPTDTDLKSMFSQMTMTVSTEVEQEENVVSGQHD